MTSILSNDNLEFKSGADASLAKLTATADIVTFSGAGGNVELRGLSDPSQAQSAATKAYVDSTASGLHWMEHAKAATSASGTLATSFANGQTIDGVVLSTGDRILIKNQADGTENGVYVVAASGAPTRAADFANGDEVRSHAVFCEQGTANGDQGYVCISDEGADVVGTDSLSFTQFTGLGQVTAGAALSKTGNQIDVEVDDSTIEVSADALRIKDAGVTNTHLANSSLTVSAGSGLATTSASIALGASTTLSVNVDDSSVEIAGDAVQIKALGVTDAMLAGSISNGKLTNSSVTVTAGDGLQTGGAVALGGSVTVDVDGTVVRTSTNQSIAGVKTFSDVTEATSTTVAGSIFSGGIGVAKDVRIGGDSYATTHNSTSDKRLKKDIQEMKSVQEDVRRMRPCFYKWNDAAKGDHTCAGLIAQDMLKIAPDAVKVDKEGYYSIDYNYVFTMLLKSHLELIDQVEALADTLNQQ
jgi:hypothetical protein